MNPFLLVNIHSKTCKAQSPPSVCSSTFLFSIVDINISQKKTHNGKNCRLLCQFDYVCEWNYNNDARPDTEVPNITLYGMSHTMTLVNVNSICLLLWFSAHHNSQTKLNKYKNDCGKNRLLFDCRIRNIPCDNIIWLNIISQSPKWHNAILNCSVNRNQHCMLRWMNEFNHNETCPDVSTSELWIIVE